MEGVFRSIFFFLDEKIYGLIPAIYNFIMAMAGVSIFDTKALEKVANNIYALIGLFVVFRVAIILLNAIVDPEKLTAKEGGASKVLINFIVALVMIVTIPTAFDLLYDFQKTILKNHVIEKVLIGTSTASDSDSTYFGDQVGKQSFSSFLTCREDMAETDADCLKLKEAFNEAFTPVAGANKTFKALGDILNEKANDGDFKYDYKIGISTIAGIIILLMLITLCMDIAVRIVKLGFLQLISPIAVVGYVDPKTKIFKSWLEMVSKTYVNLFIRLASISFVTFTLSIIDIGGNGLKDLNDKPLTGATAGFAKIFIIIGLLIFANQVPKLLTSLFGLEEGSVGALNPLAKLKGMAGAAAIGGAAGLATSSLAKGTSFLTGGVASRLRGGSFMEGGKASAKKFPIGTKFGVGKLGSTLLSGASGAVAGFQSASTARDYKKEDKMEKKILDSIRNGNGMTDLLNENVSPDFTNYVKAKGADKNSKKDLKAAQDANAIKQQNFKNKSAQLTAANNNFSKASEALKFAQESHRTQQERADQLKNVRDEALKNYGSSDAKFAFADSAYNSYISSSDYTSSAATLTTARNEYSTASSDLTKINSELAVAESEANEALTALNAQNQTTYDAGKNLEAAEAQLNRKLENPIYAKDKEKIKVYKSLKDRNQIK